MKPDLASEIIRFEAYGFLLASFRELGDSKLGILQQGGAPPRYNNIVRDEFSKRLPGHWRPYNLFSEIHALDAPRYFLVGLCQIARCGCTGQTANLDELKRQITAVAETVTPEMPRYVWAEISYRLDVCRATKGMQVEIYGQTHVDVTFISIYYFLR
jgi:hypothetical protein